MLRDDVGEIVPAGQEHALECGFHELLAVGCADSDIQAHTPPARQHVRERSGVGIVDDAEPRRIDAQRCTREP